MEETRQRRKTQRLEPRQRQQQPHSWVVACADRQDSQWGATSPSLRQAWAREARTDENAIRQESCGVTAEAMAAIYTQRKQTSEQEHGTSSGTR